jgi:hypothetical protein
MQPGVTKYRVEYHLDKLNLGLKTLQSDQIGARIPLKVTKYRKE